MKSKAVALTLAATAAAMLVTACGGGGGGSTPAPDPTLQVSGTAAVGAALAGGSVEVKCAAGSGTTTTTSAGGYSVTITNGALPCMIEVKGTVGGTAVSLHSVVEAGTLNETDRKTSALANVTPVTEMIVARLQASMPEDSFKNFQGQAITREQLQAAAAAVVAGLKDAGIDLGSIDPLKADLVAATSSGQGNAYDQLLDALGDKVTPEGLPLVVNQIALSSTTNSDAGLTNAMSAVSGGSLAGCPVAVSGQYRTLDHFGKLVTRTIDFKTMKFQASNGTDSLDITADVNKPCEFTASGVVQGQNAEWKVVMGPNGVGSYRARFVNPDTPGTNGYIFPAQSHSYSAFRGTWSFLQSGFLPGDGLGHFPGQVSFGEERKVTVCDYDTSTWTCGGGLVGILTATERADGGLDVGSATETGVTIYGYRAPNGSFALFGTTNAAGASTPDTEQTSLIGGKLVPLAVPALDSVVKFWDVALTVFPGNTRVTAGPAQDANTVIKVDSATATVTRKRDSDGREDVLHINKPLDGLRTRDAGVFNGVGFASVYQIPLPGMGLTLSVNSVPIGSISAYIANISVVRP